ncbi:acid-shock protein [Mesorhizobium sp.]|uniref:EF-hand domain-containing protein n=1 Tax=Mesorhizobium sp. TaxID=1871066 RepID=UPI000FE36275|nr:acid-shock protein [Mesorhizobium sp.]RWH71935.1 MAG: acid-shock protein [Mesorhizobium sp.]RWL32942.1 MAG: acid-shock protein [Mesorhizobium sp.]RWL33950.1 MAG: acid-shock protein [Mesorhizobium sp.]RWL40043.1 MAG: acid-shock protein [Mesorhizobium sp.]RWL57996.1 MAG: acid-shock protein [Mesorhizobium sp.]
MIRPTLFVVALGLQTAVAAAQTTAPAAAPAQSTPDTAAAAKSDQTKSDLTLEKFEARRGKAFMGADTDNDGKVSLAEWTAFQTERKAKGDPAKSFARMDSNKDGFVDKGELDAFLAKRFAKLDKNGDGVLSADERPGHKTAPKQEQ